MPTGRHNNQDRVVAPQMDTRLAHVKAACVRCGFPPNLCDIIAEGYVFRLRRIAWSNLDDVIGNGDDVERAVGWQGPPRVLAKALENAGYLVDAKGIYLAVEAISEAPEYIKARWRRHSKAAYDAAAARAVSPNVLHPRPVELEPEHTEWEEEHMPPDTLFGPMPDAPKESGNAAPPTPQSPHAKFSKYFDDAYRRVYGRGYLWGRKSDEAFIKWIIGAADSITECFAIIDAFLAERSPFYQGHALRKLYADLDRFRAGKSQRGIGRNPGKSQADTGSVIARD